MQKTYKTLASSAVIQVQTSKGMRQVYLRNGFIGNGSRRGGVFITEDEELQAGIEKHARFNSGFADQIWCDDVPAQKEQPKPVKEEPKKKDADTPADGAPLNGANAKPTYPDVTKFSEVRAILKEQYGKTAAEIKSNAQVLALINELGLVFPNLK